jgi:hypothetical protein
MVVRYDAGPPTEPLVNRRILLSGIVVGAFVVTLALTSWHNGLWQSAAEAPPSVASQPAKNTLAPMPAVAAPASGQASATMAPPPSEAAPAAPAMNSPAAVASPEASQGEPLYEQNANPGVDSEAIRRDRGVQHSSGSH